jgi:hypothetical protein
MNGLWGEKKHTSILISEIQGGPFVRPARDVTHVGVGSREFASWKRSLGDSAQEPYQGVEVCLGSQGLLQQSD